MRNTLRPHIGNLIAQPGSVAEARDRPFRGTHSDVPCAWPILHSSPSGVGLSAPQSSLAIAFIFSFGGRLPQTLPSQFSGMRGSIRSPSLISVVVCLMVERLAVYGVAVAEERSYPIRHRRHCTCHSCKHRHSGRTCIGFWAITSSVGNSPVRGGEPLYASIVLRILISKLSDISLILVFLSQR